MAGTVQVGKEDWSANENESRYGSAILCDTCKLDRGGDKCEVFAKNQNVVCCNRYIGKG